MTVHGVFWEKGNGKWDGLTTKYWDKTHFYGPNKTIKFDLSPYQYKMLRGGDFYKFCLEKIKQADNFKFIAEKVLKLEELDQANLFTNTARYSSNHIFDSRINPAFYDSFDEIKTNWQHFKGWFVQFEKAILDPEIFTMMDFRDTYQDTTSFMYVLPEDTKKALFEYTFFSPKLVEEKVYNEKIQEYLNEHFKGINFEVIETENGRIPMSNFDFSATSSDKITKIGTAGGWVKASSGYAFNNTQKKVQLILKNIKKGKHPQNNLFKSKYNFYDRIFNDLLFEKNELGPQIFEEMYSGNKIQTIFKFLDEETSYLQELKIMNSFSSSPFIKAFIRQYA